MKIGYVRVSTGDQNTDLQVDALKKESCDQIFSDTASGAKTDRPGLEKAMSFLREGDTLVVWKLDRLGRSLKQMSFQYSEEPSGKLRIRKMIFFKF